MNETKRENTTVVIVPAARDQELHQIELTGDSLPVLQQAVGGLVTCLGDGDLEGAPADLWLADETPANAQRNERAEWLHRYMHIYGLRCGALFGDAVITSVSPDGDTLPLTRAQVEDLMLLSETMLEDI